MSETVDLPIWLLVLVLAFAGIAALDRVLVPSVRWFFRRRMERLVTQLNERLERPIQPFKLMHRNDMIVRLVHDPQVMQAVVAEAQKANVPESVVLQRARRYAREIVPSFSATLYFNVATGLARWFARSIYKVRLGHFDDAGLSAIDPEATVVFVINHRSNMDYVLVTHLAADRTALSYAVGEWARIWPLSALIRSMGAYFIRRQSENPLYRRVLARYVQMATDEGVTQAIFPEGRLSLTGALGKPRLGLLSYILAGHATALRDVVFVPIAISYDRVLEDRVLIRAAETRQRRFRVSILSIVRLVLRYGRHRIRGSFRHFGYAVVGFGHPLPLSEFQGAGGRTAAELAEELMARVTDAMPVLPVPLVCAALGGATRMNAEDLGRRAAEMMAKLAARGHYVQMPANTAENTVIEGIRRLSERRILRAEGSDLVIQPGDVSLVAYYAQSVNQLLDAPAA